MDQTVITSCSKDKLQSDLWGIFNQGGESVFVRKRCRTEGGSKHEKECEGGRSVYTWERVCVCVCVVHREDGSPLISDVPERNPEGDPD